MHGSIANVRCSGKESGAPMPSREGVPEGVFGTCVRVRFLRVFLGVLGDPEFENADGKVCSSVRSVFVCS